MELETIKKELAIKTGMFVVRCLFNQSQESYSKIEAIAQNATTIQEFITAVLITRDQEIRMSQGFAELSKTQEGHIQRVGNFCDTLVKTSSDIGSVCLFNDTNSMLIPNLYGDGTTIVGIVEDERTFNPEMLTPCLFIEGKYAISAQDICKEEVQTLDGRYYVYHGYQMVIFAKVPE